MLQGANRDFWPLSIKLLEKILEDEISDRFVAALIWERLGYLPQTALSEDWYASSTTPSDWKDTFPKAPEIIAQRKAAVCLTRSIPKQHKQLLKERLKFAGYSIKELYPRRTRRATAVNWLLAWAAMTECGLPLIGLFPVLSQPPNNPVDGHPGDPQIE